MNQSAVLTLQKNYITYNLLVRAHMSHLHARLHTKSQCVPFDKEPMCPQNEVGSVALPAMKFLSYLSHMHVVKFIPMYAHISFRFLHVVRHISFLFLHTFLFFSCTYACGQTYSRDMHTFP